MVLEPKQKLWATNKKKILDRSLEEDLDELDVNENWNSDYIFLRDM